MIIFGTPVGALSFAGSFHIPYHTGDPATQAPYPSVWTSPLLKAGYWTVSFTKTVGSSGSCGSGGTLCCDFTIEVGIAAFTDFIYCTAIPKTETFIFCACEGDNFVVSATPGAGSPTQDWTVAWSGAIGAPPP